jgi:hypothetical protein
LAAHFKDRQTSFRGFEPETRGVCSCNLLAKMCLIISALQEIFKWEGLCKAEGLVFYTLATRFEQGWNEVFTSRYFWPFEV